jgi:hypothetical protein
MAELKDYSVDGKDRREWDRAWSAMPVRLMPRPPEFGMCGDFVRAWGQPVSLTISENPQQFHHWAPRDSDRCPVCGTDTRNANRLPATLSPHWGNGLNLGIGVWVHRLCFESCAPEAGPAPVPW